MNSHIKRVIFLTVTASLLGACSFGLEQKKIDYKSAGKAPSLEVPPDLSAANQDDRFAVPDINTRGSATYSVYNKERANAPQREGANLLPELSNARVDRAGSQRWLVVKASPDQVWPVVREFWQENGFIIKIENPEAGIMETDWAENRAKIPQDMIRNLLGKVLDSLYSTAERDKFRTRLEPSKDTGFTEVYVSHRGMYEVIKGGDGGNQTVWEPRPADPELEAEFLRRLMVRFGVEETRAQAQFAGGTTQERAKLVRPADGGGSLALYDPFDRAWRRVGLALDRVGFTVEDRDRSRGVYYVRYIDPELDIEKQEKKGWFSKLAFWRGDDKKKNQEQFQIQVTEAGDGSQVKLLAKDGVTDKSETAGKILTLLYEQLK
ncbi:MAG: outer membrane protein assembly factor BamC [Hydrogenophilales bacterium]|nr:outer membrane protein assembly factor BamC [Hydrogenophilales bacterium]